MNPISENPQSLPLIGHYQLLDCIGRGGMGLVFRARDTRLGREVAIKCLRTELFEPHYRERFRREALLLAKLNHPHIVHIYDFIETADQLALVMELIDGQNLQMHLREHIVPVSQRMRWLVQIAQGLAVAHDAGIIHRDLKTENVLIDQRGNAKISDLGIAKSQDFNATLTDHVAGSYCSMSPEQAMGEPVDIKSDLFSFGILAYQLLCGAHPFGETDNKLQLMQRIISHPPIAPTKRNPDLPPEVCTLLGQLLSKNPDNRPASAHMVAEQLAALGALMTDSANAGDATQALQHSLSGSGGRSGSGSGLKTTRVTRSGDHPTFDTRFGAEPSGSVLHRFFTQHKLALGIFCLILVAAGGLSAWLLQPKPPRYVAVIPPVLTSDKMHESQQELVKASVYDAIQQSVIQMEGYYLIPRDEIADVAGDMEAIRRATAADELITAQIQCQVETCTVHLSRLMPDQSSTNSRLTVKNSRAVDVIVDDYSTLTGLIIEFMQSIYAQAITYEAGELEQAEYLTIIDIGNRLRQAGASKNLLEQLDLLSRNAKGFELTQSLYREIALDLYYETFDESFLDALEGIIYLKPKHNLNHLFNVYNLQVARRNFDHALNTVEQLKKIGLNQAKINEITAHIFLEKNDYQSAIKLYQNALTLKPNANNYFNLSLAYWYSGDLAAAKNTIDQALLFSPAYYKSHRLKGAIALLEGDVEEAIHSFETVIAQHPEDVTSLANLGLSYLLAENYEQAIAMSDRAHQLARQNTTFILNKADAELLAGNEAEARALYQTIVTSTPDRTNRESLRNFAQAHAHLGQFNEAIKSLQTLQRIDPQSVDTSYSSALVYTLAGDKFSALVNIENTLKNNMHAIWFRFSWFDHLCDTPAFVALMQEYGEHQRCSRQNPL